MPVITGRIGLMAMAATGVLPLVSLGSLVDWEREIEESEIENSAQSDAWEYSVNLRKRWRVRGTYELPLTSYTSKGAQVGTSVDVGLKIEDTAPGNFFAGTGRVARDRVTNRVEDTVQGEIEIRGVGAPTINL